jgi:hypothetical protein
MFSSAQQQGLDWAKAIERQRQALIRVVAQIAAILGVSAEDIGVRLAPWAHRRALRLLRPAESACRRLIVVAARGLAAPVAPAPRATASRVASETRPAPRKARRPRVPAFKLFDPRKSSSVRTPARDPLPVVKRWAQPRILAFWDEPQLVPPFARPGFEPPPSPSPPPAIEDDGLVHARPLTRRLAALQAALADLPKQARRLARWKAQRFQQLKLRPVFTDPLRPGNPPGHRSRPTHEVDAILRDCEYLAWEGLRINSS